MIFLALIIGVVLIVAAVRNSQGALFTALMQDVPDFVVWAAAIIALGAVGYVPGLKPVSRGLLMLVITVIVLRNYKNVLTGFQTAWKNPPTPTPQAVGATGGSASYATTSGGSSSGSTTSGSLSDQYMGATSIPGFGGSSTSSSTSNGSPSEQEILNMVTGSDSQLEQSLFSGGQ